MTFTNNNSFKSANDMRSYKAVSPPIRRERPKARDNRTPQTVMHIQGLTEQVSCKGKDRPRTVRNT